MGGAAAAVLRQRLPGMYISDNLRRGLRAAAVALLGASVWVVTQATPNTSTAWWYLGGMLNGVLLLPVLALAVGVEKVAGGK